MEARRTKIIATLGEKSNTEEIMIEMIDEGLDVARVCFGHNTEEDASNLIDTFLKAKEQRPKRQLALMIDFQGARVTAGKHEGGKPIAFEEGSEINLHFGEDFEGTESKLSINSTHLSKVLKDKDQVILGNGKLKCEVYGVEGNIVKVECLNDATIEQGLRVNAPGLSMGVSGFTPEEKNLVLKYKEKADFICIPNVLTAKDVTDAREFVGDSSIKLITKMETELGLTQF